MTRGVAVRALAYIGIVAAATWYVASCSSDRPIAPVAVPPPPPPPPAQTATSLVISGMPTAVTGGDAVSGTIAVTDASGATVLGYRGTIRFTSSDPAARLPANHTFVAGDAGSCTFTVTFQTAGTQTITAADATTDSIHGSNTLSVRPRITAQNVFAVGMYGTIVHYDGANWTRQLSDSTIRSINGVWGTPSV